MTDIVLVHSNNHTTVLGLLAGSLEQLGYSVVYEYPSNADEATIVKLQTERIESSAVIAVCLSQHYLSKLQQKDPIVLSGYEAWKDKQNVFVIVLDSLSLTGLTSFVDLEKRTLSFLGSEYAHCDKCDGHGYSAQFLKLAWQIERFRGEYFFLAHSSSLAC